MDENKRNEEKVTVGFWICLGSSLLCLLGMGYSWTQVRNIRRMVAGSTERIREMSHVDIDRRMVDQMIQKAVREQAGIAARDAADKAGHDIMADMKNRVRQAVQNQTGELTKKVAQKMADEIYDIKREEIVDDVVSATTEKLVDKLGDELDNEVGKIGKVFTGIAAAMR